MEKRWLFTHHGTGGEGGDAGDEGEGKEELHGFDNIVFGGVRARMKE